MREEDGEGGKETFFLFLSSRREVRRSALDKELNLKKGRGEKSR